MVRGNRLRRGQLFVPVRYAALSLRESHGMNGLLSVE